MPRAWLSSGHGYRDEQETKPKASPGESKLRESEAIDKPDLAEREKIFMVHLKHGFRAFLSGL